MVHIFVYSGCPNHLVVDALSRIPTIDKVLTKNILLKDVQKKYARMKDVNDECPLDTGVIAQAQRIEVLVFMSDLKCEVRNNNKSLRTIYNIHEIILYNNKIYVIT